MSAVFDNFDSQLSIFDDAVDITVQFYMLWQEKQQQRLVTANRATAPLPLILPPLLVVT